MCLQLCNNSTALAMHLIYPWRRTLVKPKITYARVFSNVSPLSTEPFIHPCSFQNNDVMFRPQVVSVLFGVGNSSSSQELENLFGPGAASFEVFMLEMPMLSDLTQPKLPFNLS